MKAYGAASDRQTPLLAFLRSSAWFAQLTPSLGELVEGSAATKQFLAMQSIYREGDTPKHWVGVVDGLLKMCGSSSEGKLTTIATVARNEWIGEASLMTLRRRKFSLLAVRDTEVALIPRAVFARMYNESIAFNHYLFEKASRRIGRLAQAISNDRLLNRETRVAYCLSGLAHEDDPSAANRVSLSQTEIGELTGFTRQHVAQALHHLEAMGLITVGRLAVSILDPAGLRSFIGTV